MHNNYHFLKRLASELNNRLQGFTIEEIFTQNKDELIIGLFRPDESFYIKAGLSPQFSCLSFTENFQRARKNSVDLFKQLIGHKVNGVKVAQNDRCLQLTSGSFTLAFKLYGNRSNILLFKKNECIDLFKSKFPGDPELSLPDFDKEVDLSFENFLAHSDNLNRFIPTLGKENLDFFLEKHGNAANPETRWKDLMEFISGLDSNPVYLTNEGHFPKLLLYRKGDVESSFSDPVEALNAFYQSYSKAYFLQKNKELLIREKNALIKKRRNYIQQNEQKLNELRHGTKYSEIGDIIMANLHTLKAGMGQAELFDFYRNQPITVHLKRDLSPQKNAENYYRKSKNQKIEIAKLESNIRTKKAELEKLISEVAEIEQSTDARQLKKFGKEGKSQQGEVVLPYHTYHEKGFQILVGKNARKNDELTFKVAHKNDIWLHAKDTPGSHVVIRQVPGQVIGKTVLEKAASLAAWFSKRKTESLVDVIYTERKYVRKTRDLEPGQVIVEKEKVVLAEPVNWLERK